MLYQLALPFLFTMIIHAADSMSYALRLGGLRTKRITIAISLSGMLLLVSRTSNMAQGPLLGSMVDSARGGNGGSLVTGLHLIILASAVGTMIAMVLFPTMVRWSARMVVHLEKSGSIPAMLSSICSLEKMKNAWFYVSIPRLSMLKSVLSKSMPRRLMLLNMVVTAIYTSGVLATLYAAFMNPGQAMAASQSSGLINGVATILLAMLIDPRIALLSDRTLRGELPLQTMNKIYGSMLVSRFAGTMMAQVLLVPFALWISWVVGFL
ncbi:lipid II flippase Amj family protein [Paenibacillus sp. Marseille-Q4541]|uniref:lipid II flippase Amj family protein n=1 Tax=Paenibacillus sp. Marseille-Q4541 TaxID=2831522 RepID=UPI001BA5FD1C|nr:lipid II flippase Amj family protein [Paenibacillus sp. Marseille-Q4541]